MVQSVVASHLESRYFYHPEGMANETVVAGADGFRFQFEQVYKSNFRALYTYALHLVKLPADAEEVVQQVFLKVWKQRDRLTPDQSLIAYLYRAVHNDAINLLKRRKIEAKYINYAGSQVIDSMSADGQLRNKEMMERLQEALQQLPEQCRCVFQLSRYEGLKYHEIAQQLQISPKTVENHMGKALRLLRWKLADLMVIVLLIWYIK